MNVYIEKYRLVLPAGMDIETAAISAKMQEHDKVEVYTGNKAVSNYGITVQGSGAWASGHIDGTMNGYDYKALYKVYNTESHKSAGWWVFKYQEDKSQAELKKTFEQLRKVDLKYDLDFTIQGNDYGISAVFITYEVIRVVYNGITKDCVVTNNDSSGAVTPDGDKYPGGFKPVPAQ